MTDINDDIALNCAERLLALFDDGCDVDVINAAIKRSVDGWDLAAHISLLEDMLEMGVNLTNTPRVE